jgi:PAS domain S-box-containing protein
VTAPGQGARRAETGTGTPPAASSDESYRSLFEDALIGLGVADLQGNLLAFNDAMLEPGGYTREDIIRIGRVSALYANPTDRERLLALVLAQGYVWREEVQFVRKDGTPYDTLLSLTPVRFDGQPCMYATVEDITERKRAEQQRRELEGKLLRAQKMEAVGQMTAGIAHDFNNILSVILTSCDMVERAMTRDVAEAGGYVAELRDASRRGAAMIKKLLGFSRTAALTVVPTDLAALVDGTRVMLERVISHPIDLEIGAAGQGVALCDPGAVEQMVLNLVTNARDAMPDGGTVSIAVEAAESKGPDRPSWLPSGDYVRLSVSDTGVGMDEATLARAVEPFFTTKALGAGTGLGLSMVYGLAKQQGGFLELLSEPGRGTAARLYFPMV